MLFRSVFFLFRVPYFWCVDDWNLWVFCSGDCWEELVLTVFMVDLHADMKWVLTGDGELETWDYEMERWMFVWSSFG